MYPDITGTIPPHLFSGCALSKQSARTLTPHRPHRHNHNADCTPVNRLNVNLCHRSVSNSWRRMATPYPRNARSLSASSFSTPAGSSGTSAYSSVGKYDVSVTDLSFGGRGAGCIRNEFQSTPWNNECARISSTPARPSLQVINLHDRQPSAPNIYMEVEVTVA
jgi:hypothetical protein